MVLIASSSESHVTIEIMEIEDLDRLRQGGNENFGLYEG